ncbi:hypothetical protein FACHB389_09600 [Nostoc calcicola FACHB-389]|nr:calcium-binding protein [Nostoc calcicola FACHB-3891]OKH37718.1 hypothetical protein FACHB389_09600 [Nostoc calcicola FACHB-389]
MANIIGTNANDTLVGTNSADTINGKAGNDTITGSYGNDTLTGGGGKDTFVYNYYDLLSNNDSIDTITDFGGVGKGTNPTAAVIAEIDTIKFLGAGLTARNLLLTQNGTSLEITFEGVSNAKVILKNFKLEDLENLKASGARPAIGNILFDGETTIVDSFNVLDANSTDTTIGINNTVTFLNDLANNITGLDNSDDVVNGQGGDDKIDGLSGNDLLRGGTGNDTLIGGVGNDTLIGDVGNDSLDGGIGDDSLRGGAGNNTLKGGAGNDNLDVNASISNSLLSGGDGNDLVSASGYYDYGSNGYTYYYASGNNTLNGDGGDDSLSINYSSGNNTVSGGSGNDYILAQGVKGTNTFNGGDGNDSFNLNVTYTAPSSLVTQTVDGGTGDDLLLVDYSYGNEDQRITSTFNATTNIGSITLGTTNRISYKNIERLNIIGTRNDDYIVGSNSNDIINGGFGGSDTIIGGEGNDRLYTSVSSLLLDSLAGLQQLLDGGNGNDVLGASGYSARYDEYFVNGNNTLNGGAGDDRFDVNFSNANNLLNGGDGNDTFSKNYRGNDTIDGGTGDDLLSYNTNNYYGTEGITSTFNASTNIGSVTLGTNHASYKNIERLDITGTGYNDYIVGSNGNDTLDPGSGGNDTLDGGKGDDVLRVSYYKDVTQGITSTLNPTTNIGTITAGTNRVTYKNIERLDITGTDYNDYIVGNKGNDTLSTGIGGNDTVDGGIGDDLLYVNLYNGNGGITSTFNATTNIGLITAGTRSVAYKNIETLNITGTYYDDLIVGNNGNDTLNPGSGGNDTIIGGGGNDYLNIRFSASGNNTFKGGVGDDTLDAQYSSSDNLLSGDEGNDSLLAFGYDSGLTEYDYGPPGYYSYQTSGNNTLNGGAGNDFLNVDYSIGDNLLNGGDGNDTLTASGYEYDDFDRVYRETSGDNILNGGAGSDRLIVEDSSGDNLLDGGDGNDTLSASRASGKNTLKGGSGDDILTGGKGNDSLYGGSGADKFIFSSFNEGVDRIYDFNATNEVIQVSTGGFGGGLSVGVLSASQLRIGISATTSAQRFIYNSTTGELFFDQDGNAAGFAQVKFAQLSTGLPLTNNNFLVV